MFLKNHLLFCLFVLSHVALLAQNSCLDLTLLETNTSCDNSSDGTITITVNNGIPPYTYTILPLNESGTFISSIISNPLPAGTYELLVSDANNCTTDTTFNILSPATIVATASVTDASCIGNLDGSIVLDVSGGTGLFSYQWDNGLPPVSNPTSLPAGVYTVTITDSNGCTTSETFVVNSQLLPNIDTEVINVSCFGGSDGAINLDVVGSNANYEFLWDYGATGPNVTNLSAGTYCVTVTNTNGCSGNLCFNMVEPPPIQISLSVQSSNNNSTIIATVTGGVSPYQYLWSNGANGPVINGLNPGVYSVTVVDVNGCTETSEAVVQDNIETIVTPVTCNGGNDGSIEVNFQEGTPPYTYTWTGPNGYTSTQEDISNLPSGSYSLIIVDAQGAIFTTTVWVSEPLPIVTIAQYSIGCFPDPYIVELVSTGGTSPYTYDWPFGADPNDLLPGSYEVTVTDAVGCTALYFETVEIRIPLTVDLFVQQISCFGNSDGCIDATAMGGRPPYVYEWSNGTTTDSLCGLSAGTYSITVTDADGCVVVGNPVDINEPLPLGITFSGTPVVCNNEGTLSAMVNGSGPFSYFWADDPNNNSPDRTDLEPGVYVLTVVDANGCEVVAAYTIISSIALELESTPANCDSTGGTATATITGGANNPTFAWSTGASTASISNLAPGGYSLTVTNIDDGCSRHDNILVALDSSCFATIAGKVYLEEINQDCLPDAGAIGVAGILIQLDNGQATFTDADGNYQFMVEPGLYSVTMNNGNPQYADLCAGPTAVDVSNPMDVSNGNDFFVKYAIDKDLKIYVNKGNARPGFVQSIQICVWNYGSAPANGTLTFVHDPLQEFVSANPTEDAYDLATQTVTWNFVDLLPGAVAIFWPRVRLPASVPIGTPLNLNFLAEPLVGDLTPWNNSIHCPMVVTGSYDPNDKQVTPTGLGDQGTVYATDTLLTYLIRFQNTGTDTAFTVVVKDTLDADLDLETVLPGPSSHPYELTVEDQSVLVFTFNNIMLPDSFVNEPASNGWVFFDIRPKAGLGYGTVIDNSAAIYFDFNSPIITNTVVTTFTEPVTTHQIDIQELPFQVQPNPSSGAVTLQYQLETGQQVWINMYDWQGRLLRQIQKPQVRQAGVHQLTIPDQHLPSGVYLLQIETDQNLRGLRRLIVID